MTTTISKGSTAESARNVFANPRATTVTGFTANAGTSPNFINTSSASEPLAMSGTAFRVVWVTASIADGDFGVSLSSVTASTIMTVSFKIASSQSVTVGAPIVTSSAGNSYVIGQSDTAPIPMTYGVARTVWMTFYGDTAAVGSGLRAAIPVPNKSSGGYFEVFDVDMYAGNYDPTRAPFSGSSTTDGLFTYSWAGTANASASIRNSPAGVTPLLVTGYSATSDTLNIVHQVLGQSSPSITMGAETLRSGTLNMLFATNTDAWTARNYLTTASIFTLSSNDVTQVNMRFVRDGSLTIELDDETRSLWTMSVGYREVA